MILLLILPLAIYVARTVQLEVCADAVNTASVEDRSVTAESARSDRFQS